jgi:translation initiation factor 2D
VQHPPDLAPGGLVGVAQYHAGKRGYPLAVGRMAVGSDRLQSEDAKGKGVLIMHTWKDKLWELGPKNDPPGPMDVSASATDFGQEQSEDSSAPTNAAAPNEGEDADSPAPQAEVAETKLSPEGMSYITYITTVLR